MPYADPNRRRDAVRERVRRYRARRAANVSRETQVSKADVSARKAAPRPDRRRAASLPFIGVDGEGAGVDDQGRQHYLLMRAGRADWHMELFDGNRPLRSQDCLDFICALPADAILIGYYFGYDATQILRDLPPAVLRRIIPPPPPKSDERKSLPAAPPEWRKTPYVYWRRWAIAFQPHHYFSVGRVVDGPDGRPRIVKGSIRTINEVAGFYQKSFVEALRSFGVGTADEIERVIAGKVLRGDLAAMTPTEREYCATECRLLAELMEYFRDTCRDVGIIPRHWRGPGSLASALHREHRTPRRVDLPPREKAFSDMVTHAYYGGRFEIATVGHVPGPVYEYDISSAYPAAMTKLPCPIHTQWEPFKAATPAVGELYVARIEYEHPPQRWCCFPFRRDNGRLLWPGFGQGAYWSPEIEAAIAAGVRVDFQRGFRAVQACGCRPYDWIKTLFDYRRSLGKSQAGYPIKLALNALYGKLAQRQGAQPYTDLVAAGLITSMTRARLIEACCIDPNAVVMLATDAVFATERLPLACGPGLGEWEEIERPGGLFIVMPGIYWEPGADRLPKTRGIPRAQIIARRDEFEREFGMWAAFGGVGKPPKVPVPLKTFVGHRLALYLDRPEAAGCWQDVVRDISFDWSAKRYSVPLVVDEKGRAETAPWQGDGNAVSLPYDPALLSIVDETTLMAETNPDFTLPLGEK
jgi:hypothetical protein